VSFLKKTELFCAHPSQTEQTHPTYAVSGGIHLLLTIIVWNSEINKTFAELRQESFSVHDACYSKSY